MIQVTLNLWDAVEMNAVAQVVAAIEGRRRVATAPVPPAPAAEPTSAIPCADPAPEAPAPPPEPEPVTPTGEKITEAQMQDAMREYLGKKGMVAAREVMAKIGVERVNQIPESLRKQFLDMVVVR